MIILILTIFSHKENIKRLKLGNESKIGEKIRIKKNN
jgi:glycerol-3-phosphate acyltransferase PlsY